MRAAARALSEGLAARVLLAAAVVVAPLDGDVLDLRRRGALARARAPGRRRSRRPRRAAAGLLGELLGGLGRLLARGEHGGARRLLLFLLLAAAATAAAALARLGGVLLHREAAGAGGERGLAQPQQPRVAHDRQPVPHELGPRDGVEQREVEAAAAAVGGGLAERERAQQADVELVGERRRAVGGERRGEVLCWECVRACCVCVCMCVEEMEVVQNRVSEGRAQRTRRSI